MCATPPQINNAGQCITFIQRAWWTWDIIRRGALQGISIHEPAITEMNLLEISEAHPDDAYTHAYTTRREWHTGADWAWILIADDGETNLRLRVQSKVLNRVSNRYERLHHDPDHHQIANLILGAIEDNYVPLYCFYNSWETTPDGITWPYGTNPYSEHYYGCSVALAIDVWRRLIDTLNLPNTHQQGVNNLIDLQLPWHCLVCGNATDENIGDDGPDGPHRISLPERAFAALAKLSLDDTCKSEKGRYITNELPAFANIMLEMETAIEDRDWMKQAQLDKEIQNALPKGVRGAMVIREKKHTLKQ